MLSVAATPLLLQVIELSPSGNITRLAVGDLSGTAPLPAYGVVGPSTALTLLNPKGITYVPSRNLLLVSSAGAAQVVAASCPGSAGAVPPPLLIAPAPGASVVPTPTPSLAASATPSVAASSPTPSLSASPSFTPMPSPSSNATLTPVPPQPVCAPVGSISTALYDAAPSVAALSEAMPAYSAVAGNVVGVAHDAQANVTYFSLAGASLVIGCQPNGTCLRVLGMPGNITVLAGDGAPGTSTTLSAPADLAWDAGVRVGDAPGAPDRARLLVAVYGHGFIRALWRANGTSTVVAGNGGFTWCTDGQQAVSCGIINPGACSSGMQDDA